ncbi:MAG TPA: MFS transporter, partial [Limnochordia bacterium]|nr:MFS transporter [Limnochordia bacterium]
MPRSRRNVPLITLFLVLFTVSVGFGLVIPILPLLAREFGASAFLLGLMTASYAVVQFLFAPIWGQVSDRVGRKKVLMVGITGLAFSFLLMGFAKSYWMLFTARVLGGFLSSATLPAAQAMAAELSGTKNRAKAMGLMGAAFGTGFIFGPLIGGVLTPLGFSVPFITGGVMGLATVALSAWALREPPRSKGDQDPDQQEAPRSTLEGLRQALAGSGRPYYLLAFLIMFAQSNQMTSLAYLLTDRFGSDVSMIGVVFALNGAVGALLQGAAIGPITDRLGEKTTLLAGLALGALAYAGIVLAPTLGLAVFCIVLTAVAMAFTRPPATSLLSKVTELPQGITMGLQSSFDSLGRVIGPLWA